LTFFFTLTKGRKPFCVRKKILMNLSPILKSVTKPGRYVGGEFGAVTKDPSEVDIRFALCFPDVYEIGMSNLGMRILYGLLNSRADTWCERAFAPWHDMEDAMRQNAIPLFALESGESIAHHDFIGFSLQYELSYTNIVNMLELAGLPLLAADRGEEHPLVIGGGPGTLNPEPVADFFDLFLVGDAEEALPELCDLYVAMKKSGATRGDFLVAAAKIEGIYIPSLYTVTYNADGTVAEYTPSHGASYPVKKRVLRDLDSGYFPTAPIVPNIEVVQDRITLELQRGCGRACRFCQAGAAYRPIRQRSVETLLRHAKETYANTGYDEIGLASLSVSDYKGLDHLTDGLLAWTKDCRVNLSLPSQRADALTPELMERVLKVRSSSFTFAPEAGTQRLRDAIRKDITEEHIKNACSLVFGAGKNSVKLYFMIGLPTETEEDIEGIAALARTALECYYANPNRPKGGRPPEVGVSVSCFVPKPHTPFQWEPMNSVEQFQEKQERLRELITDRKIKLSRHDARSSRIEAVFARGNRRLSAALLAAHSRRLRFCAWSEHFDYNGWLECFTEVGIDPDFYTTRPLGKDEVFPWDVIDCGVKRDVLWKT